MRASRITQFFRRRRGESGAAAVEFALGAVLLSTMAFGAAEYGLTVQKAHSVASSVRQAARVASTPCLASTDCKLGNRSYDDYYILRSLEASMGGYWTNVEQIIIYKIVGLSQTKGDGGPPAVCRTATTGIADGAAAPRPVYCNVYTNNTVFSKLDGTGNVNLLKNLDVFEDASGADNVPQLKLTFGTGTNCGSGLSQYFCPTASSGSSSMRPRSLRTPSRVGIYIKARHGFATGMFGAGTNIGQWSVFALEPHPDDNTTDLVTGGTSTGPTTPYDLKILKELNGTASELTPGDNVSYTITVTNPAAKQRVNGAVITDLLDSSLGAVSWTCTASGGATCPGSGSTGSLGTVNMPAGSTLVYSLSAVLSNTFVGTELINRATVDLPFGLEDGFTGDNISLVSTPVSRPKVVITKTNNVTAVIPGNTVTWQIVAENQSTVGTASNANITDTPPPTISGISWSCLPSGGASCGSATSGTGALNHTVTIPPNGAKVTFSLTGTLVNTATGNLVNTAAIAPGPGRVFHPDSVLSATDTDQILRPSIELQYKSLVPLDALQPSSIFAGTRVTYRISVRNIGLVGVNGVTVTDTPPQLTNVSYTCTAVGTACTGGTGPINTTVNLPPAASALYEISGDLDISATGTLTNTANVAVPLPLTEEAANLADNTKSITNTIVRPDLAVTKTASPSAGSNVGRGQTITYTITATNVGKSNVVGATITDTAMANITVTAVTCTPLTGGTCVTTGGPGPFTATANLNANGGAVRYTVVATIPVGAAIPGNASNTVEIKMPGATNAGDGETITTNNKPVAVTHPIVHPVLAVVKSVNDNTVSRGQALIYTITVRNNGPIAAPTVTFVDTMPTQLSGVTWSCKYTTNVSCGSGSGSISNSLNLPVSETATYTINATIAAGAASGTFRNTGTATGPGGAVGDWEDVNVQDPDLVLESKTVNPPASSTTVGVGSTLTYTIVARNDGPSAVTNAVVADNVSTKLTGVTWTCTGTGSPVGTCLTSSGSGNNISVLVDLPAGGKVTLTVTGTVAAGSTGTIGNIATITAPSGVTDRTTSNNTSTTVTTTISAPNIAISKTNSLGNLGRGQAINYSIVASNPGAGVITNALVTDTIPSSITGATWTCVAAGGASCQSGSGSGNISQTVTLPPGGTATYTVTGTVSASAPMGALTNTANIAMPSGITDSVTSNNTSSKTNTVVGPDLNVTKNDSRPTMSPGQTTVYTIVAENLGPVPMTAGNITDTKPTNVSTMIWTCVASGGASCPVASGSNSINSTISLPVNGKLTYTVTATAATTATGTLDNIVTVANPSGMTDPNASNNTATDSNTIVQPDLQITKGNGLSQVSGGDLITWTIAAKNNGPGDIVGARVVDNPDARLTGVTWTCSAASGATCPAASGSGALNHTFNLNSGATTTFSFKGTLPTSASGSLTNTATVSTPTGITDPDTSNNSATDTDTILGPDLQVTKTNSVTTVNAGATTTYQVVAKNNGPLAVTGAVITDTMPSKMSGFTWTCSASGGASCPAASGSGSLSQTANLPNGGQLTYSVTGTVLLTASGTLTNTASIATPSGVTDRTPGNNSATDNDTIVNPDLEILKTSSAASYNAGSLITYTIVARNNGPVSLTGVSVVDNAPAMLTGVTWNCVASGGAACPAASGSNSINHTGLTLPSGGFLTYTLRGTIPITATGTISNTASIAPAGGVIESNTTNNTKTETDTIIPAGTTTTKPPLDGT